MTGYLETFITSTIYDVMRISKSPVMVQLPNPTVVALSGQGRHVKVLGPKL